MATHDTEGLLRISEIVTRTRKGVRTRGLLNISPATFYRGIAAGIYPKPVQIGPNSVAWRSSDIRRLMESGISEGVA